MKNCIKCGCSKPLDQFNRDKRKKDGLTAWCKTCVKSASDAHYHRNKQEISQSRKEKHAENPEIRRSYFRDYYAANKARWRAYCFKWYEKNRYRFVAAWNKREHIQAIPRWADLGAITKVYQECEEITRRTGVSHHVDHIVPINGANVSGLHVHYNLRVVPAEINLKKGNKLLPELCGAT